MLLLALALLAADPTHRAWPRFKAAAGDTAEARKLFDEIMSDGFRAAAIARAEDHPTFGFKVYLDEVERLMGMYSHKAETPEGRNVPSLDVAAILFLGTYPVPKAVDTGSALWIVFNRGIGEGVNGPLKVAYRKLFVSWFDARSGETDFWNGSHLALLYGISDVAPHARRMLRSKALSARTAEQQLTFLLNHGDKTDVPFLLSLRSDERASGYSTSGHAVLRVCDRAAVAALRILGERPAEYGFPVHRLQRDERDPNQVPWWHVGMSPNEEARAASVKKAWEWLDKQKEK